MITVECAGRRLGIVGIDFVGAAPCQTGLSGLWLIGLLVGIDMLFNGWALVMLGLAVRRLPQHAY